MSAERQELDLDRTEAMVVSTLHREASMHTQLQDSIQGLEDNNKEVTVIQTHTLGQ